MISLGFDVGGCSLEVFLVSKRVLESLKKGESTSRMFCRIHSRRMLKFKSSAERPECLRNYLLTHSPLRPPSCSSTADLKISIGKTEMKIAPAPAFAFFFHFVEQESPLET